VCLYHELAAGSGGERPAFVDVEDEHAVACFELESESAA
jgi:hypothetical protein